MVEYELVFSETFDKKFLKLKKKDPFLYSKIFKKVISIAQKPYLGKPLRNVLKNKWRTHIGHHVLVYSIDENNKVVEIIDFEHHDKVYK